MDNTWTQYNSALISNLLPHQSPSNNDIQLVKQYLNKGKSYFARYTSNFDCGHKTEWWYCIKDNGIDINKLPSKQRYRINKGLKYVSIRKIEPKLFAKDLYTVAFNSFEEYPNEYRPHIDFDHFLMDINGFENKNCEVFASFDKQNGKLCGYSVCNIKDNVVFLSVVKVDPEYLDKEVNAAIGYFICDKYLNGETTIKYICDGERNIRHQTNYQEYLVKTFGFRYAYCQLNIIYLNYVKVLIYILYPFSSIIHKIAHLSPFIYNISCVLKQEKIHRSFI
ncbi:MAG: hypothetical protein RSB34_09850 [Muribaculaceae bacterium]